jgi:hypothetical protein
LPLAYALLVHPHLWVRLPGALVTSHGKPTSTRAADTYGAQQRWLGPDRSLIRVYNRRTGKTVWTRTTREIETVRWSPDHRALAVVDSWPGTVNGDPTTGITHWRLVAWREGQPVRVLRSLPDVEGAEYLELSWSPDNQRWLLLIARGMGNADMRWFELWCLRLRDGRMERMTENAVSRVQWVGPRRIRYWTTGSAYDPKTGVFRALPKTSHERDCR